MKMLEHTIPPPIIALLCALLTWLVSQYTADLSLDSSLLLIASGLLFIIGIGFNILGIVCFRSANTTINPLKPKATSALVKTGIYKLSRNPMYVGFALLLAAWSLYLGSLTGLIGPIVFIAYINQFQIKPEERALADLFGQEFIDYKSQVRRWF